MAWECADCGEKEQPGNKIPVCHHCGKPVCKRHREVIVDDAFSDGSGPETSRVAVHCLEHKKEFHPRAANVESGTLASLGVTTR